MYLQITSMYLLSNYVTEIIIYKCIITSALIILNVKDFTSLDKQNLIFNMTVWKLENTITTSANSSVSVIC